MFKWTAFPAAMAVTAILPISAEASGAVKENAAVAMVSQSVALTPPANVTPEGQIRIVISQVNYPGVPERSACRLVIRAQNSGTQSVGVHTLLRTFDGSAAQLNTWMVPTGALAPGETSERIYSCKFAKSLILDQKTTNSWPARCTVGGEERSPCPITLSVSTNVAIQQTIKDQ